MLVCRRKIVCHFVCLCMCDLIIVYVCVCMSYHRLFTSPWQAGY